MAISCPSSESVASSKCGATKRCSSPPQLALIARLNGFRSAPFGGGRLQTPNALLSTDSNLLSLRFAGLSSWRHVLTTYYGQHFGADVVAIRRLLDHFAPDCVLAHQLCVAGQAVPSSMNIPWKRLDLYPQLSTGHGLPMSTLVAGDPVDCSLRPGRINPRYTAEIRRYLGDSGGRLGGRRPTCGLSPPDGVPLTLHDPAILDPRLASNAALTPIGFPYWDQLETQSSEGVRAQDWLAEGTHKIVISAGSFIGDLLEPWVRQLIDVSWPAGWRVAIIGLWPDMVREIPSARRIRAFQFAPLSTVGAEASAVVHHGGIGISYGTLRLGLPALVLPRHLISSTTQCGCVPADWRRSGIPLRMEERWYHSSSRS